MLNCKLFEENSYWQKYYGSRQQFIEGLLSMSGFKKLHSTPALGLRWRIQWICSERPITLCPI